MNTKILRTAAIGSLVVAAQVLLAGDKLTGEPFAVNVTGRSATIAWIVQDDEVTLQKSAGATTLQAPALRVQATTFTSLQPNTLIFSTVAHERDVTGSSQELDQAQPELLPMIFDRRTSRIDRSHHQEFCAIFSRECGPAQISFLKAP